MAGSTGLGAVGLAAVLVVCASGGARALNNGQDITPIMGFNTWEAWAVNMSEDMVKEAADAMVSKGFLAAGYRLLALDDGWVAKERNASGFLAPSSNFSSGMKSLGDYIHSKGLLYGIYESAGHMTCQGLAGTLGHEWLDAQTFADWGCDFLKYDDCYHEGNEGHDDPPILRYPLMAQALNKTGRNISYQCNFPWQVWKMDKTQLDWIGEFCNSFRVCGDPNPGFGQAMGYLDCSQRWDALIPSGPGRWHNLDAMQIGNGNCSKAGECMTEAEEQVVFSTYAAIKTPLIIGGDVRTLAGHSLATYLNPEVIAINQDPLGVPARRLRDSSAPSGEVWAGPLSAGAGVAVLVNRGSSPANVTAFWSDMGLSNSSRFAVRDLWLHRDMGVFTGAWTAELQPHSGRAIRVTPAESEPAPP